MKSYGVVLKETPLDEGMDMVSLIDTFDLLKGEYGIPVEIQAECSTAMGFIELKDAAELNYDYEDLFAFVRNILEDMNNETESGEYTYRKGKTEIKINIRR